MQNYQEEIVQNLLIDDFFAAIGMTDFPVTEKANILSQMVQNITLRVLSRVLLDDRLDEQQKAEVKELQPEELQSFLTEKGIDLGAIIVEESLKHRLEVIMVYKNGMTPEYSAAHADELAAL